MPFMWRFKLVFRIIIFLKDERQKGELCGTIKESTREGIE